MQSEELKQKINDILGYYESDGSNITGDESVRRLLVLFDQAISSAKEEERERIIDIVKRYGGLSAILLTTLIRDFSKDK